MALQYSVTLRNNQLSQIGTTGGASAKLMFFSGAAPANCATADSGTLLATLTLPATWMGTAANGTVGLSGTWTGTGSAAGTIGHFRIYDNAGTTCHAQGSVTLTAGGGDMTVDNTNIAVGQTITVQTFNISAGNA